MRWTSIAGVLLVSACSPGSPSGDGGSDAFVSDDTFVPLDTPASAADSGESCEGFAEGHYVCTPGRQCCGGVWVTYSDAGCLRDGGDRDAGPPVAPDCAATPHAVGCACGSEGTTECRAFQNSIQCSAGVWTELPDISCCMH